MNIIRELRKRANMQQKELAAAVGVSVATVSDWETQKKDPSSKHLAKLGEFFEVDPLVILGVMQPPGLGEETTTANYERSPDKSLIEMLFTLQPDQIQRVKDFVAGIKANQTD